MLVTTTSNVDGFKVARYLSIVAGEAIFVGDSLDGIISSFRSIFGGRSGSHEKDLAGARETALAEMVQRAQELGANGVIGVKLDYSTLGSTNVMLMVGATGTAVHLT